MESELSEFMEETMRAGMFFATQIMRLSARVEVLRQAARVSPEAAKLMDESGLNMLAPSDFVLELDVFAAQTPGSKSGYDLLEQLREAIVQIRDERTP